MWSRTNYCPAMKCFLLLLTLGLGLTTGLSTQAQTKAAATPLSASKLAARPTTGVHDQFVLQNGEVVLRQGTRITPLTQNVRLANGTKVNYKSGIVEFPTGKITTLQEGDYVTRQGDVIFDTPTSAAASRGDQLKPANTKFQQYVERGTLATDPKSQVATLTDKVNLLEKKVQLLNEKMSVLNNASQKQPDTSQLDQQLRTVDEQLKQL